MTAADIVSIINHALLAIGLIGAALIITRSVHDAPLGLPDGSVKSLLALLVTGSFCYSVVWKQWAPDSLMVIASMVLGYYFKDAMQRLATPTTPSASATTTTTTTSTVPPPAPVVIPATPPETKGAMP